MKKDTLHRTLVVVCMCIAMCASAQNNPNNVRYYLEAGIDGGGAFYLGDLNETPFKNLGPSFGAFCKYKYSGYHEFGLHITGGWAGIQTVDNVKTTTDFVDVSALYTFNFWNYGAKKYEENGSIVTPFVFAGVGFTTYDLKHTRMSFNVPFGLGVKVKLGRRWNIGLSWTMHKLLADNFDGVDNPYRLNGGVTNNRDWFSTFGLSLSCDFLKICAPCRKSERARFNGKKYKLNDGQNSSSQIKIGKKKN